MNPLLATIVKKETFPEGAGALPVAAGAEAGAGAAAGAAAGLSCAERDDLDDRRTASVAANATATTMEILSARFICKTLLFVKCPIVGNPFPDLGSGNNTAMNENYKSLRYFEPG